MIVVVVLVVVVVVMFMVVFVVLVLVRKKDEHDPIPCSCQGIRVLFTLDTLDSWCPHLQQQSFVSQLELVQGHNHHLPHHRCHQKNHSEDPTLNSFYAKEELDSI